VATTFTKISAVTVGSGGAASVSFSSIPSTYTDLALCWSSRSTTTGVESAAQYMTFNGVSTNMSFRRLRGNGSAADSYTDPSSTIFGTATAAGATANTFSNGQIYIPNYAGSTNKSWSVDSVTENNATTAIAVFFAGLWSNTAAITSIGFTTDANFAQYSTFTLYGIKKN
jgi:TRAP-type mannitol/chloroaromatic compound transport system substrate-binding protein